MVFESSRRFVRVSKSRVMYWFLIVLFSLSGFPFSAHAEALWNTIDKGFAEAESADQFQELEKSLLKMKESNPPLDEWAWRMGRVYYSLGKNSSGEAREKFFNQCGDKAGEAVSVNSNSGPAYFYKGLCLGKLGETRGLWSSLGVIDPLRENMTKAISLDPGFDHGGPHRALGKLYFELPFILGGDGDLAVSHLEKALNLGPHYGDNYFFLAEAYQAKGKLNKARDTLVQLQLLFKKKKVVSDDLDGLMGRTQNLLNELESDLKY